jgi:hypothetical protein
MSPLVDEFTSVYKHADVCLPLYIYIIALNNPITKPVMPFNTAVNVTHK